MCRIAALWLLLASSLQAATVTIEDGSFTAQDGRLYYTDPTPEHGKALLPLTTVNMWEDWSYQIRVHLDHLPNTIPTGDPTLSIGLAIEFGGYGIAWDMITLTRVTTRETPPFTGTDAILRMSHSVDEPYSFITEARTLDGPWYLDGTHYGPNGRETIRLLLYAESWNYSPTFGQIYAVVPEPTLTAWLALVPLIRRRGRHPATPCP